MTDAPLLEGRHAVVTGGASGIGAAVVRRLAQAGARGTVLDLADTPRDRLPEGWVAGAVDVRDDAAVARAFGELDAAELDVVVAAAGIVPGWTSVSDGALAEWDEVLRVNARGVMATVQEGARRLRDGGAIVAVASLNSWRGDPRIPSYVASKHAVLGIVRSAAMELGARGIRVNAVAPGPIATEALLARMERRERELGIPTRQALADAAAATSLGRIATVDDVANAVLFLASDLAGGVTGHMLPVDCGIA